MRKLLFAGLLSFNVFCSFGQGLELDLGMGMCNYQGDLQPAFFTVSQLKGGFFGSLKYGINSKLYIRGGFALGSVEASDGFSKTDLTTRNLSFASNIQEINLGLEYRFINPNNFRVTPYIFAGLGVFHFDPTTIYQGQVYHLQPLGTEGQGLSQYPSKKPYSLTQFCLPFGGGIKYQVNCNLNVGIEFGDRKLFTDYLDDVSGTYADEAALLNGKGPLAVALAYRRVEIDPTRAYPAEGTNRGYAQNKDWYYFFGVTVGLKINDCSTGNFSLGGLFSKGGGGVHKKNKMDAQWCIDVRFMMHDLF